MCVCQSVINFMHTNYKVFFFFFLSSISWWWLYNFISFKTHQSVHLKLITHTNFEVLWDSIFLAYCQRIFLGIISFLIPKGRINWEFEVVCYNLDQSFKKNTALWSPYFGASLKIEEQNYCWPGTVPQCHFAQGYQIKIILCDSRQKRKEKKGH